MIIHQLFDHETWTYTYLLINEKTNEAAIIDSVQGQFERDKRFINSLGVTLKYSLETHVHADHITASGKMRGEFATKTAVHENSKAKCADILFKDGDVFELGDEKITVTHTPGHTDTCTTFLVDGIVFTGDTLLIGGCGRTDFQAGDAGTLYDSITKKLFTLPDGTVVYPGHDYSGFSKTTIGYEKAHNSRLGNNNSRENFIKIMDELDLPNPKYMDIAVPGNLSCGM
ncbi:MAG: MBL fold metallo-hydrolase [Gammaproteobacteria bacterium]|nr:MBL fold metallo-hydrolase [Gammaproteobacteria bacterium]